MRLMGETLKAQWRDSVVGLCTDDYVSGSVAALWKESDTVVYFGRRAAILTYNLKYIDRAHVTLIDLALPMDDESGKKFAIRSEEHTSELQSLMRIWYAVFCLKKKNYKIITNKRRQHNTIAH